MIGLTGLTVIAAALGNVVAVDPVAVPSPPAAPTPMAAIASPSTAPPARPAAKVAGPADVVVTARAREPHGDPLSAINRQGYAATQIADRAVVGPVAGTYARIVPHPVRSGIHNFLYNLYEPEVALAFVLQRKPGKAVETVGRFVINSTVGVAGLLDVARRKPFHLPRRQNGFADTFGFYGIGPGPYFFLPLIGATTLRDLIGDGLDGFAAPSALGRPFDRRAYTIPASLLRGLDHRVQADAQLHVERDRGVDAYAAERRDYLGERQTEIDHLRYGSPVIDTHTTPPPVLSE